MISRVISAKFATRLRNVYKLIDINWIRLRKAKMLNKQFHKTMKIPFQKYFIVLYSAGNSKTVHCFSFLAVYCKPCNQNAYMSNLGGRRKVEGKIAFSWEISSLEKISVSAISVTHLRRKLYDIVYINFCQFASTFNPIQQIAFWINPTWLFW